MKRVKFEPIIIILVISIIFASCAGSSRMGGSSKKCGCGVNKGFVGY
jgi:hypothetical protein